MSYRNSILEYFRDQYRHTNETWSGFPDRTQDGPEEGGERTSLGVTLTSHPQVQIEPPGVTSTCDDETNGSEFIRRGKN